MEQIYFNKIFILQSLPFDEPQTGRHLHDDLLARKTSQMEGFYVELINFKTKAELGIIIKSIGQAISPGGMRPYLHFEVHGSPSGLVTSGSDLVTWNDLYQYFVTINEILQNQLFVSFATCYGAYIFQVIDPLERSPLFAFIGPPKVAYVTDLEADFFEYFDVLLDTHDFNRAIDALNQGSSEVNKYVFNSSESIFDEVVGNLLKLYQTRPARRNKIESMVKEAWKFPENRKVYSKEYLRNHFGKMLDDRPGHIQQVKDYFLFRKKSRGFIS